MHITVQGPRPRPRRAAGGEGDNGLSGENYSNFDLHTGEGAGNGGPGGTGPHFNNSGTQGIVIMTIKLSHGISNINTYTEVQSNVENTYRCIQKRSKQYINNA